MHDHARYLRKRANGRNSAPSRRQPIVLTNLQQRWLPSLPPGCVGRCGRRGFTQDISCARRWNMQDTGQEGVAMDRRTILTSAAASATALALSLGVSHAQQTGKIYRIGVLANRKSSGPETETLPAA